MKVKLMAGGVLAAAALAGLAQPADAEVVPVHRTAVHCADGVTQVRFGPWSVTSMRGLDDCYRLGAHGWDLDAPGHWPMPGLYHDAPAHWPMPGVHHDAPSFGWVSVG
ncbi:hypothetical protein AB0L05_24335 [Nonomuraea pusilla]|uniref:hypothetical protein n=1 Tax=Nonomuraea pusilla TaxID=46177 RepID=UPI00332FE87A